MQSHVVETSVGVKKEVNDYFFDSRFTGHLNNTLQEPIEVSSSSEKNDSIKTADNDEITSENACRQLVVYDPIANGRGDIVPVPQPIRPQPLLFGRLLSSRVLPSVGAFTVQCAKCYKWRLIPTKEKYEELREHILEQPFYCETAREWRPDVSCNDEEDISQDGSRLWAIDRPNIAQPPPGWQRLLRIRGEGSSKFADVYYVAPSGKRFRSMVEIQKYFIDHPEFLRDGVKMSQFSFQVPRPLQDNYVRKRPPRMKSSCDDPRPSGEAKAISWVCADDCTELQLGRPALEAPPSTLVVLDPPVSDPLQHRPKKRTKRTPLKQMHTGKQAHDRFELNSEDPGQATISGFNL